MPYSSPKAFDVSINLSDFHLSTSHLPIFPGLLMPSITFPQTSCYFSSFP